MTKEMPCLTTVIDFGAVFNGDVRPAARIRRGQSCVALQAFAFVLGEEEFAIDLVAVAIVLRTRRVAFREAEVGRVAKTDVGIESIDAVHLAHHLQLSPPFRSSSLARKYDLAHRPVCRYHDFCQS